MSDKSEKLKFDKMENHFSPFYHTADMLSVNSQKVYLRLFITNISLLVLSSLLSGISEFVGEEISKVLKWGSTISIALSIIVITLIFITKYKMYWFEGRAIAESIKTLAWKYITSTKPFDNIDKKTSDKTYLSNIKAVLEERTDISLEISKMSNDVLQITKKMREFKVLDIKTKKDIYLEQRIKGEIDWYTNKALTNSRVKIIWGIIIVTSQLLALISSFLFINNTDLSFNLTGFFATLAAGLISWTQAKQHQDLAVSYAIAAQELKFIYEQGMHLDNDDKQLSDFVIDAEKAISREHTLWVARRDRLT